MSARQIRAKMEQNALISSMDTHVIAWGVSLERTVMSLELVDWTLTLSLMCREVSAVNVSLRFWHLCRAL
jgi:hypothetical protein